MPDMSTFFQTPGVGGVIAATVITSIIITYALTLRWVIGGYEDDKDSK